MSKTCPICGKQFDSEDRRKRYCSLECAERARLNGCNVRAKSLRDDHRREWAKREAYQLQQMAQRYDLEFLADYVYNSYTAKRKKA